MSKLDKFVNVVYQRKISQFSDIDYDTVVVLSNTVVDTASNPTIFVSSSSFPSMLPTELKNIGKRILEHGKRVCFTNTWVKDKFCYFAYEFLENLEPLSSGDGFDKFIFLTSEDLWDDLLDDKEYTKSKSYGTYKIGYKKYGPWLFENYTDYGKRLILGKNFDITASVAGVIAGGYRNFTTHLRQIMSTEEKRQNQNPSANPNQDISIGSVRLAGNYFIEGSMSAGKKVFVFNEKDEDGKTEKETVFEKYNLIVKAEKDLEVAQKTFDEAKEEDKNAAKTALTKAENDLKNAQKALCEYDENGKLISGSLYYFYELVKETYYDDRIYADRTVLEDRLQSRLQEECLKVMTYGDGIPFTQQGANMIAAAGAVALSEATALKIIDDFETSVNYDLVTEADITARRYDKLVYRFRFSGSIEYVEVVLEV